MNRTIDESVWVPYLLFNETQEDQMAERCNCCDRELHPDRITWLEYNNATDTYHDKDGEVPAEDSLGAYPFGPACARKAVKS